MSMKPESKIMWQQLLGNLCRLYVFLFTKSIEFSPFDMIVDIQQIMTAELNTITKDLLWQFV